MVYEDRDGGDGRRVQPFAGKGGVLEIEGVEVVEAGRAENVGDGAAAAAAASLGVGVGVGEEPSGVEMEEEDEEDDEKERDDGGEHDVAVVGEDGVKDLGEGGGRVRLG